MDELRRLACFRFTIVGFVPSMFSGDAIILSVFRHNPLYGFLRHYPFVAITEENIFELGITDQAVQFILDIPDSAPVRFVVVSHPCNSLWGEIIVSGNRVEQVIGTSVIFPCIWRIAV